MTSPTTRRPRPDQPARNAARAGPTSPGRSTIRLWPRSGKTRAWRRGRRRPGRMMLGREERVAAARQDQHGRPDVGGVAADRHVEPARGRRRARRGAAWRDLGLGGPGRPDRPASAGAGVHERRNSGSGRPAPSAPWRSSTASRRGAPARAWSTRSAPAGHPLRMLGRQHLATIEPSEWPTTATFSTLIASRNSRASSAKARE